MNNLIKEIGIRHKAQSEVMVYEGGVFEFKPTDLEISTHKDRGDLLAVIDATRALLEEWRDEYGDYPQSKDDCADELEALLNGGTP